jgi:hypothetical protein
MRNSSSVERAQEQTFAAIFSDPAGKSNTRLVKIFHRQVLDGSSR